MKKTSTSFTLEFNITGGDEELIRIHKALLLGIEVLYSHKEHSGERDHHEAVWVLSSLLKNSMLTESQSNVALGGKACSMQYLRITF